MEPIQIFKHQPSIITQQVNVKHVTIQNPPEERLNQLEKISTVKNNTIKTQHSENLILRDTPRKLIRKYNSVDNDQNNLEKIMSYDDFFHTQQKDSTTSRHSLISPTKSISNDRNSNERVFIPLIFSEKYIYDNNEFIKKSELKPLELNKYKYSDHEKKFDQMTLSNLVKTLESIQPTFVASMNHKLLEFCQETIKILFHKNKLSFDKYLEFENEYISSLLFTIQEGGVLIRNIFPRILKLRNNLSTILLLNQEKTIFTERLYLLLTKLTKIEHIKTLDGKVILGRSVSNFLFDIDQMLLDEQKIEEIVQTPRDLKLKSQIVYQHQPIANLILQAIGGVEQIHNSSKEPTFKEAFSIITYLRDWAKPGMEGQSEAFQILKAYCNTIAQLCIKAAKLRNVEFHCHIDHLDQEIIQGKSIFSPRFEKITSNDPSLKNNSVNSKAVISKIPSSYYSSNFTRSDGFLPTSSYPLQGKKIFKTSYSLNPIDDAFLGLIPNRKILPHKIIVNDKVFHNEKEFDYELELKLKNSPLHEHELCSEQETSPRMQEEFKWAYTTLDPTTDFWFNLFKCFYTEGLGNVNDDQIKSEVNLMNRYLYKARLFTSHPLDIEQKLPCLKIVELMTLNCREIAHQYMTFLFPLLFPKSYDNNSPYSAHPAKGKFELKVEIESQDIFSVTQLHQYDIHFLEKKNDLIATITYSWKNRMTSPPLRVNGWDAILKLDCKVHNLGHWESIMEIITNPDLSACKELSSGLHFSKKVRDTKKRS